MPFHGKFTRYEGPPAGTYTAVLQDVKPIQKKMFQSEETEPGIRFQFKIFGHDSRGNSKEFISSLDCRAVLSSRSKLFTTLQSMSGKLPEGVADDDGKMSSFVNALIGQEYIVTVDVSETGYSNIGNVIRVPGKAGPKLVAALKDSAESELEGVAAYDASNVPDDVDEIPF